MSKYALFAGDNYYPLGGWDDFKGHFDSIDAAKLWLQKNEPDCNHKWAHLVYKDKIIEWAYWKNDNWIQENGVWLWRTEN